MEYCSGGDLEKVLEERKQIKQPVFLLIIVIIFCFEGITENHK
jgi:hypothetical protein